MLIIRTLVACLFHVGILALIFLVPAETWYWFDAIIFLIIYSVLLVASCTYMCLFHPASLKARLAFPQNSNQPVEDKFATVLIGIATVLGLIFIPLDVFHFQIFVSPSLPIKGLGLIAHFFGWLIMGLTIIQNKFAQPVVNIQRESGQVLIDSGPYAYVRHPLYCSFIFYLGGMSLWLGSIFMATVGTMIIMLTFIPRILIEERILRKELAGYEDYMNRVKHRIIPNVV